MAASMSLYLNFILEVDFNIFLKVPDQFVHRPSLGEDIIPDTSGAPVLTIIVDLEFG